MSRRLSRRHVLAGAGIPLACVAGQSGAADAYTMRLSTPTAANQCLRIEALQFAARSASVRTVRSRSRLPEPRLLRQEENDSMPLLRGSSTLRCVDKFLGAVVPEISGLRLACFFQDHRLGDRFSTTIGQSLADEVEQQRGITS